MNDFGLSGTKKKQLYTQHHIIDRHIYSTRTFMHKYGTVSMLTLLFYTKCFIFFIFVSFIIDALSFSCFVDFTSLCLNVCMYSCIPLHLALVSWIVFSSSFISSLCLLPLDQFFFALVQIQNNVYKFIC